MRGNFWKPTLEDITQLSRPLIYSGLEVNELWANLLKGIDIFFCFLVALDFPFGGFPVRYDFVIYLWSLSSFSRKKAGFVFIQMAATAFLMVVAL